MTGRQSRDRGIRFERLVAHYLGTVTTRSEGQGAHADAGDVVLPGHIVECKDHARWTLPEWWRHLEAKCGPGQVPVLVVKARGRPVGDALVVQRLADWWPDNRPTGEGTAA